jgi:hypothetical protein
MSVPGPLPPVGSGPGQGPFGERAFRAGLALSVAAVAGGLAMVLFASGAIASVGVALLALGGVGLGSVALGFLAEMLIRRRTRRP